MSKFIPLLLLTAASALAATTGLLVFDTKPGGQLYSPVAKLPNGHDTFGNRLYFRSQPRLNGRVIYTEPGRGTVGSAAFGRPGEAWVMSTPGHSQDVESYNIVKVNLATGKVIARAETKDVGMVTSFPAILEYNLEKDWIRVRGARGFAFNQGAVSQNSEVYWLSLSKNGLRIEKAFPDGPARPATPTLHASWQGL